MFSFVTYPVPFWLAALVVHVVAKLAYLAGQAAVCHGRMVVPQNRIERVILAPPPPGTPAEPVQVFTPPWMKAPKAD